MVCQAFVFSSYIPGHFWFRSCQHGLCMARIVALEALGILAQGFLSQTFVISAPE
jgi:hypothetical protein